ncbi:MAG: squalene/phytoene synthase family protein [Rhodospirillales bacterium]
MDIRFEARPGDVDFSLMPELFAAPLQPTIRAFGHFVRIADGIADDPTLGRDDKAAWLRAMAAVLDGDDGADLPAVAREASVTLREGMAATGVSAIHARHLLEAFEGDVSGARIETWNDLLAYCRLAAAPIGRFMLELASEDVSVCGPSSDALCAALRILKRLRDCKHPSRIYSRLCIPEQFMRDAFITTFHLEAPSAKGQTRAVIDRVLDGVERLLHEAAPLPGLMRSRSLGIHAATVLCRARKLTRRFRQQDPFNRLVGLSRGERLTCKWISTIRGMLRWR